MSKHITVSVSNEEIHNSKIKLFSMPRECLIDVAHPTFNNGSYHRHDFLELSYIVHGSAIHYFNNESVIVREGDYFAVDFGEIHRFQQNGDEDFEIINCIFFPEFIDVSLKDCTGFAELVTCYNINFHYFTLMEIPTKVIHHDDDGTVRELFRKMEKENERKAPKYHELLRCYLIELIILTLRKIHNTEGEERYTNETVNRILDIVKRDYAQDLRLNDICSELGYSMTYISALFTKTLGISFSRYLQNVRVENACHLLASTEKNIEEISGMVGYKDVKFFRELFKSKLKMSPKTFRDMSRRKNML